jgi:hypothetical protein
MHHRSPTALATSRVWEVRHLSNPLTFWEQWKLQEKIKYTTLIKIHYLC